MNKVHLADCMDIMRKMPDKSVDLCIVDPPYGIDVGNMTGGAGKNKQWEKGKCWDKDIPNEAYFIELSRISKNQIIWGGNYFPLPLTNGWIVWDKDRRKETTFSDGEMAWTNFLTLLKIAKIRYDGFIGADKDGRIHPTQKPVALYKWLLKNYAKPGDKIFDSHVGSGSIRIACHDMGFDFEGCEIDKDYWEAQEKRYNQHIMQGDLFSSEDTQKAIYQEVLF
jgi:site-specific DNA-methyltransferase (adenine-specific)